MQIASPEDRDRYLRRMPNAILATRRRNGGPQLSPVWYLWTGQAFLVSSARGTAKVANVRRDPAVSLCIDSPETGDYVVAYGDAVIIEGPAVREPTLELIRKYRPEEQVVPHWERIAAEAERVLISLTAERMLWRER